MKFKFIPLFFILFLLLLLLLLSSCIKDEPLFREADIISFEIESPDFINDNVVESNRTVNLIMTRKADLTALVPSIVLSEGAVVEPAPGIPQDFSSGKKVIYTVTSQDGQYKKEYTVSVSYGIRLKHGFENWEDGLSGSWKYPILSDTDWSSANQGVTLAWFGKVKEFPTVKTEDCVSGKYAAMLKTVKGRKLGSIINVPIFSGSLFLGKFETNRESPLKSLYLGHKFPQEVGKPYSLKGYYKYTPGEVYQDKNEQPVVGKIDEFDAYAIIFKVSKGDAGNGEYLNGETVFTSDKVIARAEIKDKSAKKDFIPFSIPFIYTEEMDYSRYDYKLSIVFASSKDGNLYEGAIGSTLIVDDIEIVCNPFDQVKK